jgi:hypothetical protein
VTRLTPVVFSLLNNDDIAMWAWEATAALPWRRTTALPRSAGESGLECPRACITSGQDPCAAVRRAGCGTKQYRETACEEYDKPLHEVIGHVARVRSLGKAGPDSEVRRITAAAVTAACDQRLTVPQAAPLAPSGPAETCQAPGQATRSPPR